MSETRVKCHPVLGILVGSGGHVMVPANGHNRAHWTLGSVGGNGYRRVAVNRKEYLVHRLVAETFIPNPNCYREVDHIDRNPLNNDITNLRWANRKMQLANRGIVDASIEKYGVRKCEDPTTYYRERRKKNPEIAKRHREHERKRRATDHEYAERLRALSREWKRNRRASVNCMETPFNGKLLKTK